MSISMRHLGLAAAMALSLGVAGCASANDPAPAAAPAPVAAPAPAPAPAEAPARPAGKQLNAAVQTALNAQGARLKVDGSMGPKTRAALRAFQRKHQLKPTGHPDDATLKALGL